MYLFHFFHNFSSFFMNKFLLGGAALIFKGPWPPRPPLSSATDFGAFLCFETERRRYGVVDGKFCFEGGSLCGKGEGLHVFLSDECEEISWNMQMASEGRLIPKRRFVARNMSGN